MNFLHLFLFELIQQILLHLLAFLIYLQKKKKEKSNFIIILNEHIHNTKQTKNFKTFFQILFRFFFCLTFYNRKKEKEKERDK